ncbi:MAG: hypothetical protein QM809_08665 [Gordonia sp. (in: high G+C Gram-positive bacteria)]|uniref:hypothetical protein n=1 Tax=Gordonia sp. (in: high G+C Gram-positive bacteria) TaxID=84139 RepID=UPI0039E6C4EF
MRRTSRSVAVVGAVLICVQLLVRGWLVARGSFYWDDLVLIGRASETSIFGWDYLTHSHDGHFMPAAFLVSGIVTSVAPLQWWLPALVLLLMQAAASISVWRMIGVLAPESRVGAPAALAFYLFSPLTVASYLWWAAGLNALPLQAALAIVVANAVLLAREPDRSAASRRRLVAGAVAAFVVALAFFEKSLVIVPVAVVAVYLATRFSATRRPESRGGVRVLWWWLGGVFAVWAVLLAVFVRPAVGERSASQTATLVRQAFFEAFVPILPGGPWWWERWIPSPPMADPAVWMHVAGWLSIVAVVGWSVLARRGAVAVWGFAAAYVVLIQIPVMWFRSGLQTSGDLGRTLRYLPDSALVITVAIALVAAGPVPAAGLGGVVRAGAVRRARAVPAGALVAGVVVLTVSSLISTFTYLASWREGPTRDYLETGRASLQANRGAVVFDQQVPLEVLLPFTHPYNRTARVFARVPDRARFDDEARAPLVLDEHGVAVPAGVSPVRQVFASAGSCEHPGDGIVTAALSEPVIGWDWTVELSYCATRDGKVAVVLGDGPERTVHVDGGLHSVFFRLRGGGGELRIRPLTPGLRLSTGAGRLGETVVAAYLW